MAVTEPVPARVDATGKAGLLALVDHAVGEGWTLQAACEVLKISRRRVERWQSRRTNLEDRRPGGVAVNSLLADEVAAFQGVAVHPGHDEVARALALSRAEEPVDHGAGRSCRRRVARDTDPAATLADRLGQRLTAR